MTTHAVPSSPIRNGPSIAPLEAGDHLTRDEFERRYEVTQGVKKAELIEGVVYMSPAVRWDYHGRPHADLMGWLAAYRAATPGVQVADNSSVRLDLKNEPQPDAAMIIEPGCGGQSTKSDDGYLEGAPELAAEISGSSVSIDLNTKLRVYRRNSVREYIVWRVHDDAIDWFTLQNGEYVLMPATDGIIRSQVFPGLWLDPAAMLRGDLAGALAVLQKGISTAEHSVFVDAMRSKLGRSAGL